jgi:anti-anti-sigma factor
MSICDQGPVTVLRLSGDLGQTELLRVEQALRELTRQSRFNIVMNMRLVRHLDYTGLAPLRERAERLRAYNGDLRLAGLSPHVRSLFGFSGLADEFRVFGSEREARLSFSGRASSRGRCG